MIPIEIIEFVSGAIIAMLLGITILGAIDIIQDWQKAFDWRYSCYMLENSFSKTYWGMKERFYSFTSFLEDQFFLLKVRYGEIFFLFSISFLSGIGLYIVLN